MRWKSDTCDCVLEYKDEVPSDIIVGAKNEKITWTRNGFTVYEQEWRKSHPNAFCNDIDGKSIPRSTFNVINLSNEAINFLRAVKKCNLHKNLEGIPLAESVITLNREINKKRNVGKPKGIIQATITVELTPHLDINDEFTKLANTQYNFENLKKLNPLSKIFIYELSNFLNSSQSLIWHMIKHYSEYFDLQLKKTNMPTFVKIAKDTKNDKGIQFSEWLKKEYGDIVNSKYGFLLKKRHLDVHIKTAIPDKAIISTGEITIKGNQTKEIPIKPDLTKWYFEENTNDDIIILCEQLLIRLTKLCTDSKRKAESL